MLYAPGRVSPDGGVPTRPVRWLDDEFLAGNLLANLVSYASARAVKRSLRDSRSSGEKPRLLLPLPLGATEGFHLAEQRRSRRLYDCCSTRTVAFGEVVRMHQYE